MRMKPKKIYFTPCPVEVLSHVAFHEGFFKSSFDGTGVELAHISVLPAVEWDNHFTHRHPHFLRDGGNIPPIWTRSCGADTYLVGITFPRRRQVLLTRKDFPGRVEDLAGKRVALPKREGELIDFWRATLLRGTLSVLEAHGMTYKDVTFVDVPVTQKYLDVNTDRQSIWTHRAKAGSFHEGEILALQTGLVDAVYTEGARIADIEKLPDLKVLYTLSDHHDLQKKANICMPCIVTASGELVRNYPDLVRAYMTGLMRCAEWVKINREQLIEVWSRELYLEKKCVESTFPPNVNELLMPRIDREALQVVESQIEFLLRNGFIQKRFELSSWVREDFLS